MSLNFFTSYVQPSLQTVLLRMNKQNPDKRNTENKLNNPHKKAVAEAEIVLHVQN